ncbi:MAG TPA: hybrid sensor histidine kinase/response regulator [Rhodocyclaceae bacterium]
MNPAPPEDRILLDQVRETVGAKNRLPSSTVAANLMAVGLLIAALYGQAPSTLLYGWSALLVAYQLLRVLITKAYWTTAPEHGTDLRRWARRLALLAVGSGCLWGITGLIFFAPASPMHQALLTVLLCAMAAGSIPANAMLLPGLVGSVVAILGMLIGRLVWIGDAEHLTMAAMLVVYLGFVLNWGRGLHRVLVGSLQRRHENADLVEKLRRQTDTALSAQRIAEEASLAKSKFLAAASHDLRQPMHALALFAGAMANEHRPGELRALSHHIGRSVEALEMLFNSLLDISKLDAGVMQPKIADVQLEELFRRLRNDLAPVALQKGLRLRVRPTRAILRTDGDLLEQILRNLVANAIRYTETGGVVVGCRRRGPDWRIDVADSGIGIAEEQHARIFDEFYQIGNPERDRTKGLGLGLAIVSRLARLLDVPLSLRSRVAHGTVFSLSVKPGIGAPRRRAEPHTDVRAFGPLRVLVIDDEPEIRLALESLLGAWGCTVLSAESQQQAAETMAAQDWMPDVALVDFRLREGATGIEVLDWLRAHVAANLPGIIITGDIGADRLQEVRMSGYPLLHKPVSPAKLRAVLARYAHAAEMA